MYTGDEAWWARLLDRSGVNREVHAPFWERPEVRFLRPTQYSMHWVLDVAFGEDDCCIRCGDAPHNFAILRRIALNLLKGDTKTKLGIANKRLKAGWDVAYLSQLLGL